MNAHSDPDYAITDPDGRIFSYPEFEQLHAAERT